MTRGKSKIIIIGCGVSGLSCGICLLKAKFENVHIMAKELPPHTTSDVAAAIWRPYQVKPEERAIDWALASLKSFKRLASDPQSGVRFIPLTEVYRRQRSKPAWMQAVKIAPAPFIPKNYPCSFSVFVPLIDTSIYMAYLMDVFRKLGGTITQQTIHNFNELSDAKFIINCAGLGARQLSNDHSLFPIKGQVIRMSKPEHLDYGIVEYEDEMTYIYPRFHDCIVGGTAEENQWELAYDETAANDLLKRATQLCPSIQSAKILEHKVGLRPARSEVRLDAQPLNSNTTIIHNYGHGGRGFTLSWGCAKEVCSLIRKERSG